MSNEKRSKSKDSNIIKTKGSISIDLFERPWYASYGFLGSKVGPLIRHFKGLRDNFNRASLPVDFNAYVSFLLFGTGMAFALTFGVTASINQFILHTQINYFMGITFPFLTLPLLTAALSAGATFASIYTYPSYIAHSRRLKIEASLLYAVSYMSIIATAGLSPERIFRSLASKPEIQGVYDQARFIVRDIDMFGIDFISALNNAIERSPSKLFGDFLEGFVSLIYSGGNLSEYLKMRTDELTKRQADLVKSFISRLSMLSEAAVAVIAVFPLIFIVSFSVSSLLPGGMFTQPVFIYVMIYLIIPFICILFLVILKIE